jgi:hypothetical protein
MERIVVDLSTGEQQVVPLTDEEIAAFVAPGLVVPASISPLQARKALRAANLMEAVNAWLATQPEEVREEWEYAREIERDNPTIAAACAALGLTEEQRDQLFVAAAGF